MTTASSVAEDSKKPRVLSTGSGHATPTIPSSRNVGGMETCSMQAHMNGMDDHCDGIDQQVCSCVANGKLYQESRMVFLAAAFKCFDITDFISQERGTS